MHRTSYISDRRFYSASAAASGTLAVESLLPLDTCNLPKRGATASNLADTLLGLLSDQLSASLAFIIEVYR
jgi:hypothetical protein